MTSTTPAPDFIPLPPLPPPQQVTITLKPPPPPQLAAAVQQTSATAATLQQVTQVTTVYVGKIPPDMDDTTIRRLLDACGAVRLWRRVRNPLTNTLKPFGFCDFESPEGVAAAVAALGTADIGGGHTLLVKADEKAQQQIDAYFAAKRANALATRLRDELERRSHLPPGMEDDAADLPPTDAPDGPLAREIDALCEQQRAEAVAAAKARIAEELAKPKPAPVPPPTSSQQQSPKAVDPAATADATSPPFVTTAASTTTTTAGAAASTVLDDKDSEISRELAAWKERTAARDKEQQQRRQQQFQRQQQRRQQQTSTSSKDDSNEPERRLQQQQQQRDQLRDREIAQRIKWEREFRDAERQYESRERERLRRLATFAEEDPIALLIAAHQSRRLHTKRERQAERREDEEDRRREAEEQRLEAERAAKDEEERRERQRREEIERKRQEERLARERAEAEALQRTREAEEMEREQRAQGIYGSFLPAEPVPARGFRFAIEPASVVAPSLSASASPPASTPLSLAATSTSQAAGAVAPVFEDEAAAEIPKRKRLIKLDDDGAAASQQPKGKIPKKPEPTFLTQQQPSSASKPAITEIQRIVELIPTGQAELFAWKIDWDVVERYHIIEQRMRPWVAKKITEYLGEEDRDLVDFIVKQLHEHPTPEKALEQLKVVLEEDALLFVIKIWRMLIFEILSSAK